MARVGRGPGAGARPAAPVGRAVGAGRGPAGSVGAGAADVGAGPPDRAGISRPLPDSAPVEPRAHPPVATSAAPTTIDSAARRTRPHTPARVARAAPGRGPHTAGASAVTHASADRGPGYRGRVPGAHVAGPLPPASGRTGTPGPARL
ncbi:hypothetical protein GCM10010123_39230 [Pilimelia anulata]|uniref:Uncharacterized protein n=1 Tax=Pilimelia anulata TaxID=53371 RepID=A0A8J3BCU3_9ACTN|nr:hypothetical protein GCM10010123_39230 [Pilimelia anulata]